MSLKCKIRSGYPNDFFDRMNFVSEIANFENWKTLEIQENIGMISFYKSNQRINIYLTKMTVTTLLNHPKRGRCQLYRKNVTVNKLKAIFLNPRKHTGIGYYTKNI